MNAHNFTHAGYLARIKAAVVRAVRKSGRHPHGVGHAQVYNRRDRPSLEVYAITGRPVQVWDQSGNNVTALAMAALRQHHAQQGTNL